LNSCIFSVFSRIRYCPHFVRLSVRLSVCLSVRRSRYYFSRGCPIRAIYGSIDSLWPKDPNDGRNYFGPVLDPVGGVWSPNSVYFHIKIGFYWYLRRVISLMLDREGRGQKWAESKSAFKSFLVSSFIHINQPWPTRSPRAACGLGWVEILYFIIYENACSLE
jgi:hypothetical protein